jgi:dipeptidyl aminopeptidase/acylaminoacyl peptidase
MGEVYRARDTRLSRDVALKVLSPKSSGDGERLRRFEQEARAAGVLNHPNVVVIYDVGSHEGSPFVVAELLEGETLRGCAAGGSLSTARVVELATQVARGLAAAHAKGIVHRDLKPENVFVTTSGVVKLLDFGVAKLSEESGPFIGDSATTAMAQTHSGAVIGTAPYMSPEQARGQRVDARSDIFSVGIILYELLTGSNPFVRESAVETMHAIIRDDAPPLGAGVPAGLALVVAHCLEKRPSDRFQSAQDLAYALEALGPGAASGSSRQRLTVPRFGARDARRRWMAAAAAVVVLAAVPVAWFAGRSAGRMDGRVAGQAAAVFRRVTFRRGRVENARMAPDGRTIVYSAVFDGPRPQVFSTLPESAESRPFALPDGRPLFGSLLSISSTGELALLLDSRAGEIYGEGTLARVQLGGGAPRELLENVLDADWSPDGESLAVIRDVEGRTRLEYPIGTVLLDGERVLKARVSPSGDRVAFVLLRNDLYYVGAVDTAGARTTLSRGLTSVASVAWGPSGDELWYAAGESALTTGEIHALALDGRERVVARLTGSATVNDVARDGRVLVTDASLRAELRGLAPGGVEERDLSWLDVSVARSLSDDGQTLLINEDGEGGGRRFSVYARKTDGSAAVRLAEGMRGLALSPDGKWALALVASPPRLVVLPTGPGEPRPLPAYDVAEYVSAAWFPDGRRFAFVGTGADGGQRAYVASIDGEAPRPITSDGIDVVVVSPDGRFVAAHGQSGSAIYPVDGGAARPLAGLRQDDTILQWDRDGRTLYVYDATELPRRISRYDVASGRRETWKEVSPPGAVGNTPLFPVVVSRDGRAYAYTIDASLSSLYLVDGWR